MIEIKNLKKSFAEKTILHDVSLTMDTGKCNLIIGSSGSGKTVLMKCLVGLFAPDNGSILYDDLDMISMSVPERKELRQKIGMLFQGSALFDSMTVEQNIKFPLDMFTNIRHREKMKKVNEVLDRVNLKGANNKFPSEISGGMKKRVGIARSIVLNPKYLFCDEPNSGLDPQTSLLIDELIHDITHEYNMTTVINTHDMNSVMGMGDKVIYMYMGQKQWEGNNKELFYAKDEKLAEFIFATDFMREAKELHLQHGNKEQV
ncbi:MAG: methionine transporter ATP-binding protein [Segetibacter sp.]|nr:methionine transporter ATP-binding protein [Segetibacter sp.]